MIDFFNSYWDIPYEETLYTRESLSTSVTIKNSFGISMNIEVLDDWTIRTPLFLVRSIARHINNFQKYKTVVVNLRNLRDVSTGTTSKALLASLREFDSSPGMIGTFKTSKQIYYKGCLGLIMKEDYSPIYIQTVDLQNSGEEWIMRNPMIRVSPSIFENSTELIEKTIIKQIPSFINNPVWIRNLDNGHYNRFKCDFKVENLDYMINIVQHPKLSYCTDNSLNSSIIE